MNARERSQAIIQDILTNHLPRIKEGLEKGYVDENQILVMYDHAVRARILNDHAGEQPEKTSLERNLALRASHSNTKSDDEHVVVPSAAMRSKDKNVYNYTLNKTPRKSLIREMTGSDLRALLPEDKREHAIFQEATGNDPDIQIADTDSVDIADEDFYSVPPATFGTKPPLRGEREHATMLDEASFHRAHADNLECVCGGLVKEVPTLPECLLKCDQCQRVYMDEQEVFNVRKTEVKGGEKYPDGTYYTTGTLANGTDAIPMETEINLNGRKTTIKAKVGRFVLSYEEIVRMTINQYRNPLNKFAGSDAELPMLSCVYSHRVAWNKLHGERIGLLSKGQKTECTPGMSITCIDTGNA